MLELTHRPMVGETSKTLDGRVGTARERRERMLCARVKHGDRRAREELIERFLPLARSVARRFERPAEPIDDLVQVASMGLVKAVDRYDVHRGFAFSSYAVPTIAGELKRHFRDRSWTVRPPRAVQELTMRLNALEPRLTRELDRAPTVGELASACGATDEQVLEALQAQRGRNGLSLQAPAGGEDQQNCRTRWAPATTASRGRRTGQSSSGCWATFRRVVRSSYACASSRTSRRRTSARRSVSARYRSPGSCAPRSSSFARSPSAAADGRASAAPRRRGCGGRRQPANGEGVRSPTYRCARCVTDVCRARGPCRAAGLVLAAVGRESTRPRPG